MGFLGSTSTKGPKWNEGQVIDERNKKFRDEILSQLDSHSVPYHARLLAAMDLERN